MSKKNNKPPKQVRAREKFIATVLKSRTPIVHRKDISDWQAAKQSALRVDNPRFDRLQELYDYIMDDAHLASQVQLRKSKVLRSEFALVSENGNPDDKASDTIKGMPATRRFIETILDAQLYGYNLVELRVPSLMMVVARSTFTAAALLLRVTVFDSCVGNATSTIAFSSASILGALN